MVKFNARTHEGFFTFGDALEDFLCKWRTARNASRLLACARFKPRVWMRHASVPDVWGQTMSLPSHVV